MSWNECKPILAAAQALGYRFLPIKDGAGYMITIYGPDGGQLDTATGQTWTEAARAAVACVERDQRRRAA